MEQFSRVPISELTHRMSRLRAALTAQDADWRMVLISHKINLYYLTGTMQEGVLVITPSAATLWVRRSYTRATEESFLGDIRPMRSFRALREAHEVPETIYLEAKYATIEWLGMVQKHLPFAHYQSVTPLLNALRAVKSDYEIECMRDAGAMHAEVLDEIAPCLLREGMSEAELAGEIYTALLARGSMGISRFNQPLGEDVAGLVAFSENALAETAFDGPGGTAGTCIAMQGIGSSARLLRKGDLVFIDMPAGRNGYHTDKSVVYYFGDPNTDPNAARIRDAYAVCLSIMQQTAARLVPGADPEAIYAHALSLVPPQFAEGFMHGCHFLGHSIGLMMDEPPVLAHHFNEPLQAGMTFAVEPKIALDGIGIVGIECTYLIRENAPAISLNGEPRPLRAI